MLKVKAQAGEQMTVIWFLFLVFIMVIGLGAGIFMFFGSGYDSRNVDADILNYKIKTCLSENTLNLEETSFEKEFYQKCRINKKAIDENFYIYINDTNNAYKAGKGDLTQCSLQNKNDNYPRCTNSTVIKDNKIIFIQTGSNQWGKEVLV